MKLFNPLVVLLLVSVMQPATAQFDAGRADLSVIVNNEIYPYREFATYVLPAEHLDICIISGEAEAMTVSANSGTLDRVDDCRWIWTAPDEPGLTQLSIMEGTTRHMTLNVFVMVPASRMVNGRLDGVLIGEYPEAVEFSPIYLPPDGFIRVTEEMLSVNVSPNFKLGQFVEQTNTSFPKYIVLRERLLLKLEVLLGHLNDEGYAAESLSIVRGYITPQRNRELGNSSGGRHIYGGAATFIVDADGDGRMDDLDGNGTVGRGDGALLFEIVDELFSQTGKEYLQGGLYLYDDTTLRTPLLMMDARGFRKRWENDSDLPELPENLRQKHKRQFE